MVIRALGLGAVAFIAALAVIVGYRMSAESMAVVVGVVCGVGASVPISAILLLLLQRQRRRMSEAGAAEAQMLSTARRGSPSMVWGPERGMDVGQNWQGYREPPPVIIVQGGQAMPAAGGRSPLYLQQDMLATPQRDFRVIGGEWAPEPSGV
jgi:hypothetical protein